LLARLAADRFRLAIVGQFSRGKTTLLNALLGGPYLPMGALPMTSVITRVCYGSRPRAMVRRRASGLRVEVPLTSVAEYIGRGGAERAELQVTTVEVELPAEILRLGIELVDTPGVGSAIASNTATTRQFLPQADAVIFVTGFDSPLTDSEAGFLADVTRQAGKLFLVMNKRDLVSGREAGAVAEFVRRRLREDLGLAESRLFGLSALEALQSTGPGDGERLSGSGLVALRAALTEFLTKEKTRLFLRNVAERGAALVTRQRRDLKLGRLALDGGPHPSAVLTAFGQRMAELDRERRDTAGTIMARVASGLPDLLNARSQAWRADLRERLEPCIDHAVDAEASASARSAHDLLGTAQRRLEEAARGVAADWLERRTGEVLDLLTEMAGGEITILLETARSPGMAAAEIAGLAGSHGDREPGGWTAADLPDLAVRLPEWTVRVPREKWRRKLDQAEFLRRVTDALTSAISAYEAGARSGFADAARDWARRLDEQSAGQMADAAAHVRRRLRTRPTDEDLAAVDDLAARIAGFAAALDTWEAASDAEAAEAAPQDGVRSPGGCPVCEQMEEALTENLRRDQFRLATLERDQQRHALARGYCPLHTWQYAAIASPVGISAGHARLAAATADALETACRRAATLDLAGLVAGLVPQSGTCTVCAALAERERKAIIDITESASTARSAALCLHHLGMALRADPESETGRAMVQTLAHALRRDAEDMRAYALKREALYRGLVTEEESGAYLDALRRLAGLSALAGPGA